MHNVILLGAPGSGKGTQAQLISEKYGIPVLTMGDIIRAEIKAETDLGLEMKSYLDKGDLVPDAVISNLFLSKVTKTLCEAGFISDGVPRTLAQAKLLQEKLDSFQASYKIVLINVSLDQIMDRLSKRGREDDTAAVIENRFKIYESELNPILDFYRNKVNIVNGNQELEHVFSDICKVLN